jgi:hypothetical protein
MRAQQVKIFDNAGLPGALFGLHSGRVGGAYALRDANWKSEDIGADGGWTLGLLEPDKYTRRALKHQKNMFHSFFTMGG